MIFQTFPQFGFQLLHRANLRNSAKYINFWRFCCEFRKFCELLLNSVVFRTDLDEILSEFHQILKRNFLCNISTVFYFKFQYSHFHINIFKADPQTKFREISYQAVIRWNPRSSSSHSFLSYIAKIRYFGSKCYSEKNLLRHYFMLLLRLDSLF